MISDVLSEAIDDIRRYRNGDWGYEDTKPEIDLTCAVMDALRLVFDTSPSVPGDRQDEFRHRLRSALAVYDGSA